MLAHEFVQQKLKSAYREAKDKNPRYSYRSLGQKVSLSASSVYEVIQGTRKLGPKKIGEVLTALKVPQLEFSLSSKKTNPVQSKLRLFDYENEFETIDLDMFNLVSDWYYFAILSLFDTKNFKSDEAWIAKRLRLSRSQVSEAISCLLKLELIKKDTAGKLVLTQKQVNTPTDILSKALQKNYKQSLELQKKSLELEPLERRDFSSMTMSIDPADLPMIKKNIKEFRETMAKRYSNSQNMTQVYRLNLSLIPLTVDDENEK